MELRHYLRIVRRSWPLVVGLPVLVALISFALAFRSPQRYAITAAMLVTQRPIATKGAQNILPDQNNWNSWAASDYILDDILSLVQTRRFADDIAAWLQSRYQLKLDPQRISQGLSADRQHHMVYLHATADTSQQARQIAEGGIAMLQQKGLQYWNRADTTSLDVSLLDLPSQAHTTKSRASLAFNPLLRTVLALILAIMLAFFRHYLDQSIHRRGEVEALGFEVLGVIPRDGLPRPQP
jgi:capsular polysaccharide biosynthesis protein